MLSTINKVKNVYRVFGLNIESEIELNEFLPIDKDGEIKITLGKVKGCINYLINEGSNYMMSNNEFIFIIEDVAQYYIIDGKQIVIDIQKDAKIQDVKLYLITTAIGIALLQRRMVIVHGSSVVINNQSIIFTGESGSGKSTICAALRERGYGFLTDDISVITIDDNRNPMVQPAFPQQRLCYDTAKIMKYCDSFNHNSNEDKLILNVKKQFIQEPATLVAIIEILPMHCSITSINKIIGSEKISRVVRNLYYNSLLTRVGMNVDLFKKSADICNKISYFQLRRPIGSFTIEDQIKLIEESLNL